MADNWVSIDRNDDYSASEVTDIIIDSFGGDESPDNDNVNRIVNIRKTIAKKERAIIEENSKLKFTSLTNEADNSAFRRLDSVTMRKMYSWSSYIRAGVDGIARIVSSLPWNIVISKNRDLKLNKRERAAKRRLVNFFDTPNSNKETFRQILQSFITDALVVNAGCIEKSRDAFSGTRLVELTSVDAATIRKDTDIHGNIRGYQQVTSSGDVVVEFPMQDLIFETFFPRTYSVYGLPILESIALEVETLLNDIDNQAKQFSRNEVPQGLLWIKGIGATAVKKLEQIFKNRHVTGLMPILRNVDNAEWVSFDRKDSDRDKAKITARIEAIIWRAFGLTPIEMGQTEGVNRSIGDIQVAITKSRLIKPIIQLIEEIINDEVVSEFTGTERLRFKMIHSDTVDTSKKSDAVYKGVDRGVLSTNEAREILADDYGVESLYEPIKNGGAHNIRLGNRIFNIETQSIIGEGEDDESESDSTDNDI